jgi:hypothetical protein
MYIRTSTSKASNTDILLLQHTETLKIYKGGEGSFTTAVHASQRKGEVIWWVVDQVVGVSSLLAI